MSALPLLLFDMVAQELFARLQLRSANLLEGLRIDDDGVILDVDSDLIEDWNPLLEGFLRDCLI